MSNITLGVLNDMLWDEFESLTAGDSTSTEARAKKAQINAFMKSLNNGDKQACEIRDRIDSGDIPREDVFALLNEFLAAVNTK